MNISFYIKKLNFLIINYNFKKIFQYKNNVVWFQDYHFLVAPSLLRKAIPTSTIGLFLHTPFPTSEIFRSLASKYKELN